RTHEWGSRHSGAIEGWTIERPSAGSRANPSAEARSDTLVGEKMAPGTTLKYKRILLKLSGEALEGEQGYGIDAAVLHYLAEELAPVNRVGAEVASVIGGGNIRRGRTAAARGMDRAQADYMGMLAPVINALALQDALESAGIYTRLQTAIEMPVVAEPFIRRR